MIRTFFSNQPTFYIYFETRGQGTRFTAVYFSWFSYRILLLESSVLRSHNETLSLSPCFLYSNEFYQYILVDIFATGRPDFATNVLYSKSAINRKSLP